MKTLCPSLLCLLIVANEAKVLEICELYYRLKNLGMDNHHFGINHFVCIALFSTKLDTHYFNHFNGHPHYGIFSVKGTEWCNDGKAKSPNKCKIECSKFLDDNIKDDVECVKKIVSRTHSLTYWPHYEKHCNIRVRSYISTRCIFFFMKEQWYHKIMSQRLPQLVHVQFTR